MKAKRITIGLSITFCAVILIWFVGWAVWTDFHLWDTIPNVEYKNTLYVLIFLTVLMGGGLTMRKSKGPIVRQDVASEIMRDREAQNPLDLGPIIKRLDILDEKVADLHVVMKFLKNVKEKNGEKP